MRLKPVITEPGLMRSFSVKNSLCSMTPLKDPMKYMVMRDSALRGKSSLKPGDSLTEADYASGRSKR